MKNFFIWCGIIWYCIITSLIAYYFLDTGWFSILFPIIFPLIIGFIVLGIFLYIFFTKAGFEFLDKKYLLADEYMTIKPLLTLLFFFLNYSAFAFISDGLFFETATTICPTDTNYYHLDANCSFLSEGYYADVEETTIYTAWLKGRKPCYECVEDYHSIIEGRRNSIITYGLLFLSIVIMEYLCINGYVPKFVINVLRKIGIIGKLSN